MKKKTLQICEILLEKMPGIKLPALLRIIRKINGCETTARRAWNEN